MSEQLFEYSKVEINQEPKLIVVPTGLEEFPELLSLVEQFEQVSEDYLGVVEIQDYTTAELLVPALNAFLTDIIGGDDSDAAETAEAVMEMGGLLVTQVIQLTGNQPSIIVSITILVDADEDEDEEDSEEDEEKWD